MRATMAISNNAEPLFTSWHSYPSIFNLGHRAVLGLLDVPVIVEEKVDGSQFSFGKFPTADGRTELRVRSKGAQMHIEAPEKMFSLAVETVRELEPKLNLGWTYRAEYLRTPKHNALVYDRIPSKHLIIFDISPAHEQYLTWEEKAKVAEELELEAVPLIFEGKINDVSMFRDLLNTVSVLGGQKIEGVVIKPLGYTLFGEDKKVLMGKFVSEAFKEVHSRAWKESNPGPKDIIQQLADEYTTQARWQKAVQHLREQGKIEDAPRDIGILCKEVPMDIRKECEEEIKDKLFKYAWPHLQRKSVKGLAEWYKEELLKKQFE